MIAFCINWKRLKKLMLMPGIYERLQQYGSRQFTLFSLIVAENQVLFLQMVDTTFFLLITCQTPTPFCKFRIVLYKLRRHCKMHRLRS